MDELERVAQTGAYLQFDLIGIDWINSDRRRAQFLAELIRRGQGYRHLIDIFLPMLREEGVDEGTIHRITHTNPARVLSVEAD